jgi:hypothetical protein
MAFEKAVSYAKTLDACGHKDWRLPAQSELKLLFKNRDVIGGFSASASAGGILWYWSCTEPRGYPSLIRAVAFTDGRDDWVEKDNYSLSTRVVRGTLIIQRVYRPHLRFILMFDRHVEL